jgi:hypothetical protein
MQKYYVAVSDIHFGNEDCTLMEDRNQRRLINLLEQEIGDGRIQELVSRILSTYLEIMIIMSSNWTHTLRMRPSP